MPATAATGALGALCGLEEVPGVVLGVGVVPGVGWLGLVAGNRGGSSLRAKVGSRQGAV